MGKKGACSFLYDSKGKINIAFVLSLVFIFVMMLLVVNAITITQSVPTDNALNGSRTINFTFTTLWGGHGDQIGNCSIWTNITGTWAQTVVNSSNGTSSAIFNSSSTTSWINYTFDRDNVIAWSVRCTNNTATGGDNFSVNRTLTIDNTTPSLIADTPKGVITLNTQTNFTAYPLKLMVNVSDNTTSFVWAVINSLANGAGTNETGINRTMTVERVATGGGMLYNFTLDGILNFSSQHLGPGVHSVFFCANDSLDRVTCAGPYDYVIKGTNVSEMERMFGAGDMQNSAQGFSFTGMDIRYGNGTDVPFGSFINPTAGNFTFNMNLSSKVGVYIVGGRIDEKQFGNASNTNYSAETTTQSRQAMGTGYDSNLTWVDIKGFIPSEVSYEFGIVQMPDTYNKVMYCNGTSPANPSCFTISRCNSSNIGLFNFTEVIPTSSPGPHACWLTSGGWGEEPVNLASGFTYIFTRAFSGGLGGNDRGGPEFSFSAPTPDGLNVSVVADRLINVTVSDTNSTGLNLTRNHTINVSIFLGGSRAAYYSYINNSGSTNLTCTTTDTVSPGNTTKVFCNVTYNFNSNGTYLINASARDDSNNTNYNDSAIKLTVDQIYPVVDYFNITHNVTTDFIDPVGIELGLGDGVSTDQGRTIYPRANWTDNLTQPQRGLFQFYNTSKSAGQEWQTLNESLPTTYIAGQVEGWTNFSFPIPSGHNNFEGANISFRIIANDTAGNVNNSVLVKNFTIQINDSTKPTLRVTIGIEPHLNGTNVSTTTPTITWNVTDNSVLRYVAVQIDGSASATCNKFANYTQADDLSNSNRNGTITVSSLGACPLGNGTRIVRLTSEDEWGNSELYIHSFSVQSGSVPALQFNLTAAEGAGTHSKAAINNTNITSSVGITLFGTNGVGASIDKIAYISSCNSSSSVVVANNTVVYPFNESSCNTQSENRTLTVTINDTAGNSNTTVLGFLVDNVGPTITVNHPTSGQTFTGRKTELNFSVLDDDQAISFYGYYDVDTSALFTINISAAIGAPGLTTSDTNHTNFTAGTHRIKFTVNDTLGNVRNSSVITFTQTGPIRPNEVNSSLNAYLSKLNPNSTFNVSIRVKDNDGNFQEIGTANETDADNTFEIFLNLNSSNSNDNVNVTITEINGSGANWDKINFSVFVNDTKFEAGVENNFTAALFDFVVFNNSLNEFLSNNNDYFATVLLPSNISGSTATAQEIWYFENESDITTRTNVSKCTSGFSRTSTSACWNYTSGGKTLVYVPHFSGVGSGNDSRPPTITINKPIDTQAESSFLANITVSNDAVLCNVSYVGASSSITNKTMAGPSVLGNNKVCTFHLNVTNGTIQNNNITFNVFDASNNLNTTVFNFNVSDLTVHNLTSVANGTTGSTTWKIDITANESVNVTINYSTSASLGASSAIASETDFEESQTVSLSSLTADKIYYFNVTTCDKAGNCIENGTFMFKTNAAAVTTTTTTTTTTTGGGGAAVSKVADSKAQVWSRIPVGSSVSLDVDKATIAITSVAVNNVKSELKNVDIEVQALKSNPVSATAAGKVFQYLRINKKKIADGDAESIKISFRVTKSWLTDNGLTSADVRLYRYKNSVWNRLSTSVKSTDSTYVNFEAETPGFSFFAVGSATGGGDAFAIIDAIREFYAGTSSLSAFEIIDMIRAFYG